jgi:hypothetical protein
MISPELTAGELGYRRVQETWIKPLGFCWIALLAGELQLLFRAKSGRPVIWASAALSAWEVEAIRGAEHELLLNGFPQFPVCFCKADGQGISVW